MKLTIFIGCFTSLLIVVFFFTEFASSHPCQICDNCKNEDATCFCKKSNVLRERKRWSTWRQNYYIQGYETLYSYATCYNMDEDNLLETKVCPGTNCKYITFVNSSLEKLPLNSFINVGIHTTEIYLNSSQIKIIQTGAFSGLPELKILHLEDNEINKISRGSFNALISLEELDLSKNSIESIDEESFLGVTNLSVLNLAFNNLQSIRKDTFAPSKNLKEIILTNNSLTTLDLSFQHFQNLQKLIINYNNLENLGGSLLGESNIKCLDVSHNTLTFSNNFEFPAYLEELDISFNNITTLNSNIFENLSNLSVLSISNNQIVQFSLGIFKDLENLVNLDISQNYVENFEIGLFSPLSNLTHLNISHLGITKLDTHTFIPLKNLQVLDINGNNLNSIEPNFFEHFEEIKEVHIGTSKYLKCSVIGFIMSQAIKKRLSIVYKSDFSTNNINGLPCEKTSKTSIDETVNNAVTTENARISMVNWKGEIEKMFETFSYSFSKRIQEHLGPEKLITKYEDSVNKTEKAIKELLVKLDYVASKIIKDRSTSTKINSSKLIIKNIVNDNREDSTILMAKVSEDQLRIISDSMYEMKIILLLTCLTCIFFFAMKKIASCRKFRKNEGGINVNNEMPILKQY